MIALLDALNIMDAKTPDGRPVPFSIRFCKITTGEIVFIEKAVKNDITKNPDQRKTGDGPRALKRKPNHTANRTRNIRVVGTDQIRQIGIYRITAINNEKVFL